MNLILDSLTMVCLIIASTTISFYFERKKRDIPGLKFLAFSVFVLNVVFVMRITGVTPTLTGAENLEDAMFLFSALSICMFTISTLLHEEQVTYP